MSDTINIGGIKVSKFYLGGSSDVKIYLGTTKLYPHLQEPCFAVVDNISTYTARTYVDVYETSSDKWYKLNNLNQYEEYGVYDSTTATTYYDGKLVIEDGYEYQYSGSGWNNVGEISGSSRIPLNFTEVEYIENTSTAYINTEVLLYDSTTNSYNIQCKCYFQPYGNNFEYLFGTEGTSSPYVGVTFRYYRRNIQYASNPDNVSWTHIDNGDGTSGVTASCASTTATNGNNPLTLFCGLWSTGPWRNGRGKIYSFKVTKNNGLIRDLVPCKRNSDNMVGMYDVVNEEFYYPPNYQSYQLVAGPTVTGSTEYPIYYDELQDPPDNVVFSSMVEAESYECPWVGMHATINGDKYIFSGDSQSGYEWIYQSSRLPAGYTEVEYIENTSQAYLNLGVVLYDGNGTTWSISTRFASEPQAPSFDTFAYLLSTENTASPYYGFTMRWENGYNFNIAGNPDNLVYNLVDNGDGTSGATITCPNATTNNNTPLTMFVGTDGNFGQDYWRNGKGKFYTLKVTKNDTLVRDLVPTKRDSDNKYGMYDLITDTFYLSPNNVDFSGGSPV